MATEDRIWRLIRQPFIFPTAPRLPHRCAWEIFATGRAGCTLCGDIHVCDSLTCAQKIITEDSIICSITGFYVSKLYGAETWSDRSVYASLDNRSSTELAYDVETHLHDLLLSHNARRCTSFEQSNYAHRLACALEHAAQTATDGAAERVDCVADALARLVRGIHWRIPVEFCGVERARLTKTCAAAIHASAAMLFKNKYFKICLANQKAVVFGLVYLLRSGVTHNTKVVLPQLDELCAVLPLESHLKAFFGVSPSSITDTENRLKFMIRQNAAA
jgi:hypothetical protein